MQMKTQQALIHNGKTTPRQQLNKYWAEAKSFVTRDPANRVTSGRDLICKITDLMWLDNVSKAKLISFAERWFVDYIGTTREIRQRTTSLAAKATPKYTKK